MASGSVADTLRAFVRLERIDWITMGAFGRSRLNEFLFGTRPAKCWRKQPSPS